jgi:hypothetical protein
MPLSRSVFGPIVSVALVALACGSGGNDGDVKSGPSQAGANASGSAGSQSSGGSQPPGGSGGSGSSGGAQAGAATGGASLGGAGSGGDASAGGGGTPSNGGAAGSGGSSGGAAGDACGAPAPRAMNFDATAGAHTHTVNGLQAAVYGGVPHLMGKLIVQLDNNGYAFGAKRGFHVLGVSLPVFNTGYTTRNFNGDCRLEAFDGVDRCADFAVTPAQSVTGQVTQALKDLQSMYPEEDWGYFLNADSTVRWSDVGFTGHSHRAQSATRFAVAVCAYRAVARSGPRDNLCGKGQDAADFDPQNPPYDPNCPVEKISAWLDDKPKTPIERFFGFVGKADDEYGDIQFTMERMHFVGKPINISVAKAPYDGTHRFYADAGHDGFDSMPYWDALNIAWGVPAENATWALTH